MSDQFWRRERAAVERDAIAAVEREALSAFIRDELPGLLLAAVMSTANAYEAKPDQRYEWYVTPSEFAATLAAQITRSLTLAGPTPSADPPQDAEK